MMIAKANGRFLSTGLIVCFTLASILSTWKGTIERSPRTETFSENDEGTRRKSRNAPSQQMHTASVTYSSGDDPTALEINSDPTNSKESKVPCDSLYRKRGGKGIDGNEHSPLVFHRHNILICRNAKVGSEELRRIAQAYETETNFTTTEYSMNFRTLSEINDTLTFHSLLYGDSTKRLMFVRHPVRRILSGFIQVTKEKSWQESFWGEYETEKTIGGGPDDFAFWLYNTTFAQHEYNPTCSNLSTQLSMHDNKQHFAPPYHCRCGIWDCGVHWEVIRLEDHTIRAVLERYMPGPWIPPPVGPRVHKGSYNASQYLAPDVLDLLNTITAVEQKLYGYKPLTFEEIIR